MHDWDEHQYVSDNSTERVRKYRSKQAKTVSKETDGNVGRRFRNGTDSETDSEAEADADADTKQNQNARSFVRAEWPETAAAVREFFPASDDAIIAQIVQVSLQAYANALNDHTAPILSDGLLAAIIRAAHFEGQYSAGGFLWKVPKAIKTWAEEFTEHSKTR